jgi:two-component system OmpR family sensor kinase
MSLRARLVAVLLGLLAFGLLATDVLTYRALRSSLYDRVDSQLAAADTTLQQSLRFRGGIFVQSSLEQLGQLVPGAFVQVRVGQGTLVTLNAVRADGPVPAPDLPGDLVVNRVMSVPSVDSGAPGYRVRVSAVPGGGVLVVALPLADIAATLHRLLVIEVLVTAVVFGVGAGAGFWLVRLGLRPLADIEATAGAITSGDMSERVALDDAGTEVGRLGAALNVMLDTLDDAFAERRQSEEAALASEQRMRRFVADASHELRTPVAAVRAYAELYRRGADTRPEDLARLLSRIESEAERMGVLVDDLLLLTRLDEGRPLACAVVDVGAVASDAVEAARAVEPVRPLALEVVGSVEVSGDRGRLRQVFDNLLANVRSHTPEGAGAAVRVRADAVRGVAVVEVEDSGPGLGLSDDEAGRVFERFYRVDAGRSRDRGGAGLGLSIVAAIVGAHGGSACVRGRSDGKSGAVFRVELPLLDVSENVEGGG